MDTIMIQNSARGNALKIRVGALERRRQAMGNNHIVFRNKGVTYTVDEATVYYATEEAL